MKPAEAAHYVDARTQRIGYAFGMKAKTHFAFNIDVWDAHDINIVEHLAGLDDFLMAVAAYDVAVSARPREKITLRQGARIMKKNWQDGADIAPRQHTGS